MDIQRATPQDLIERNIQLENEMREQRLSLSKANAELIKYRMQKKDLNKLAEKVEIVMDGLEYKDKPTREAVIEHISKLLKEMLKTIRGV